MNDTSYCSGRNCALKNKCARYVNREHTSIQDGYRWFVEEAYKNGNCNFYKEKK